MDAIFDAVKRHADQLADGRADRIGVLREYLITTPEEMISEFLRAEESLLERLRLGLPIHELHERAIDDVAGIKVIMEDEEARPLLTALEAIPDCEIMEQERHTGQYNAVNLIVRYRPPKEEVLGRSPDRNLLAIMGGRGWSVGEIQKGFSDFVQTGEEWIHLEIIASSYGELLESEIGCSMHEHRIIEQRQSPQYRGYLAKNIEYLMRYFFIFPFSGRREITELPIKIWNRYLPDYFDAVIQDLFQIAPYGNLE